MVRSTIDVATVRKIGLALPGVAESTACGFPALKAHGQLLACLLANPSAEPGSTIDYEGPEALAREHQEAYKKNGDLIRILGLTQK
jgi:hypothetical protein